MMDSYKWGDSWSARRALHFEKKKNRFWAKNNENNENNEKITEKNNENNDSNISVTVHDG